MTALAVVRRERRAQRLQQSRDEKKYGTAVGDRAGVSDMGGGDEMDTVNDDEMGAAHRETGGEDMVTRAAEERARRLAAEVRSCLQKLEAAELHMTQLTAEAETKEQTARRLEEELRSERCGEESGLFMIEEISESKLRRAIGTLRGAKAQADARRSELKGMQVQTKAERLELEVLQRNAVCLESLERFDAAAEPPNEQGRRRLRVEYSHGGQAGGDRGRHYARGGYWEEQTGERRTLSLQGCPREVRSLLAGEYYYDVDMVNSLPNVAAQLARLGMTSEDNLRALQVLCANRTTMLRDMIDYYGLRGKPELDITARDVAKALPIRLLHGGSHENWRREYELDECVPVMPFAKQLETELARVRHDVYVWMKQHDAVWTASVEAHIRQQKAGPYDSEESLQNKVEAGIFARVIQNIEDVCLDKARRVLRSEGWTARSWQQDGLLVEGQLRAWECDGWSGNVSAKLRLESAMRRAEAAVADSVTVDGHEVKGLKVELLIKPFYQVAVGPTLARFARPGSMVTTEDQARAAAKPAQMRPTSLETRAAAAAAAAAAAEERSERAMVATADATNAVTAARMAAAAAAAERRAAAAAAARAAAAVRAAAAETAAAETAEAETAAETAAPVETAAVMETTAAVAAAATEAAVTAAAATVAATSQELCQCGKTPGVSRAGANASSTKPRFAGLC